MLSSKSFLAVDFGAGSLKLAEFEINESGGLLLKQYGMKPLGAEGAQESTREAVMLRALQEVIAEKGIRAKNINVCAPGFHVFSKFVKLPPVDTSKVTQIIQYEAQQNVPFPLEEVVWDYQILGSMPSGELEVLLVAIKAEIVEGLFRVADTSGLSLQLADVSPAALCNAFRYNYGDLEDCTMLLDIGAKTSNLLFFEKGKVYARGINIGANSITQDFGNEAKLPFTEAEKLKISEGFVSLGGAYEEPENPHQAAISKIARQFMTRLHIQVNQTMQFYRGQQGGSAPKRLFLSGGAAVMPYTAQFFAEKLNIPVEYFNPLRNVQIDPSIDLEELARVAHSLGEVVGLGLRNLAHCPVELNLMPETTLRWQQINQKKPYFIATVFSLVLVIFSSGWLFAKLAAVKGGELEKLEGEVKPLQLRADKFKRTNSKLKELQEEADTLTSWMHGRYYWADFMTELRRVLIHAEDKTKKRLGVDAGVWVEKFTTTAGDTASAGGQPAGFGEQGVPGFPAGGGKGVSTEEQRLFWERYGAIPGPGDQPAETPAFPIEDAPDTSMFPPGYAPDGGVQDPALAGTGDAGKTDQLGTVTLIFRAVSLASVSPSANTEVAFALLNELRASPVVDPEETQFAGNLNQDDASGTFTFGITLKLKEPIKQ